MTKEKDIKKYWGKEVTKLRINELDERFCRAFIETDDAERAAIMVGLEPEKGVEIYKRKAIKDRIKEIVTAIGAKYDISNERILKELAYIAFSDPRDVAEWGDKDVKLKDSNIIPKEAAKALHSISISKSESVNDQGGSSSVSLNFKHYDKLKALELLGKHLKMFTDRVEHSGVVKLEELILQAMGESPSREDYDG